MPSGRPSSPRSRPNSVKTILLGGSQLNYQGVLTTEHEGRVERSPGTFHVYWGRTEITGSWTSEEPRVLGLITGGSATNPATVEMRQTQPCRVDLTGTLAIGDGAKTLEASYTGSGCEGGPLKVTFTGTRQ
jgi:hypothetical protein